MDSFNKPAVFATYGLSHGLLETQDLEVRAGARVLGAYKYLNWQGPRSLIATVGPTLSLRHKPTGIALNGLYALNVNLATHKLRNIFMLQTSLDF